LFSKNTADVRVCTSYLPNTTRARLYFPPRYRERPPRCRHVAGLPTLDYAPRIHATFTDFKRVIQRRPCTRDSGRKTWGVYSHPARVDRRYRSVFTFLLVVRRPCGAHQERSTGLSVKRVRATEDGLEFGRNGPYVRADRDRFFASRRYVRLFEFLRRGPIRPKHTRRVR